jgi:hypothetical protein
MLLWWRVIQYKFIRTDGKNADAIAQFPEAMGLPQANLY